jgi:lysophospholipase
MGFEHDVADFGNFLNLINKTMGQSPKCLIAHSMGGHFSLKFIENNPNYFDCAIMIAPMFGVNLPPFLKPVANLIASASQSTNHMPGMQSWTPEFHEEKVRDVITSDPMRGNLIPFYYSKNEELECGGVTCRWYTEALKSNRELIDSDLSEINTPILFVLAEREQVVDNEAVKKIATKIENGELCTIGLSQHGIHLEIDMIRNQLWEKIDRFTQKHLHFKPNA